MIVTPGTCAFEMAVVDDQMKVRGIKNDASVMPQIISGNLNAPTQILLQQI